MDKFKYAEGVIELSYADAGAARGLDSIDQRLAGLVSKSLTTKQSLEGMLSVLSNAAAGNRLTSLFAAIPQAAVFTAALAAVSDAYMKISGAAEEAAKAEEKHAKALTAAAEAAKTAQVVYRDEMRRFEVDQDRNDGRPESKFDKEIRNAKANEEAADRAAMAAQNDPIRTTAWEKWQNATGMLRMVAGLDSENKGDAAARERHNAAVREANNVWGRAQEKLENLEAERDADLKQQAREQRQRDELHGRGGEGWLGEMGLEAMRGANAENDKRTAARLLREENEAADIEDRIMGADNGRQADFRNKFAAGNRSQTFGITDLHSAIQGAANDPNEIRRQQEAKAQLDATLKIDENQKAANGVLNEIKSRLPQALA